MAKNPRLTLAGRVDRLVEGMREEARNVRRAATRLAKAVETKMGLSAGAVADADMPNPHILAARGTRVEFLEVFGRLSPKELRRVLSDYNLASPIDLADKTPAELLNLLFERAQSKLAERRSALF